MNPVPEHLACQSICRSYAPIIATFDHVDNHDTLSLAQKRHRGGHGMHGFATILPAHHNRPI
jgi:hypothetical protein